MCRYAQPMGTLRYPGAPDFTYTDEVLATLQQIIAMQQKSGQGFWLERQGKDEKLIGHDAVWISPDKPIYVEFDSIDIAQPNLNLLKEWELTLVVHGADKLVLRPSSEVIEGIKGWIAEKDEDPEKR